MTAADDRVERNAVPIWRWTLPLLPAQSRRGWLAAAGLVLLALDLCVLLDGLVENAAPFVTLYPAVVLAGLISGTLPAIMAVGAGAIAASLLWLHGGSANGSGVTLAAFLLSVGIILWATAALRRALLASAAAEVALREALRTRELLVREADHRIKNSLQIVIGLLRLQRGRLSRSETASGSTVATDALGSAIARVESIAQSHDTLHRSKDLVSFDFGANLHDLCAKLGQLNPAIALQCGVPAGLVLDAERAVPLSLIISELLTNALRYAYPDGAGVISVNASVGSEDLTLTVADEGTGIRPERGGAGLGTTIIGALAGQIGAAVATRSAPGAGTTATVRIKRSAAVPGAGIVRSTAV